jgi:hypothetical protein
MAYVLPLFLIIGDAVNGEKVELNVDNMKDDEIYAKLLSYSQAPPVAAKEESVQ